LSFDESFEPSSFRPYLLRGFYHWLLDNETTPMIQVDAEAPASELPLEFAMEGLITLNVSPRATAQFNIANEWVSFQARFSGQVMHVKFPIQAVMAIWAREVPSMQLHLEPEPYPEVLLPKAPVVEDASDSSETASSQTKPHPFLRVVK
jgi:stringent starvation protein B